MTYVLRHYQSDAVSKARECLRHGKRAPIIVAPTGAGKTVIACHIINEAVAKGSRVLFLAHRNELIMQCSKKLDENDVPHGIIKSGNRRIDMTAPVQVASVQTIVRRLDKLKFKPELIITDECHHGCATTYMKIYNAFPQAVNLGLTATPFRADGKGLGSVFDCGVEVSTISELIEWGYLVKTRLFIGRQVNTKGIKKTAGDFNQKQLAEVVAKPKLVGNIVEQWIEHGEGRQTVCFAVGVEHSKMICESFEARGIKCGHLDGSMSDDERSKVLNDIATGRITILCNCAVLTEGWDCPQVSCLILARPTESSGLFRQMGGRVLRPFPGKTDCIILDHGNCTETHGRLTDPIEWDLSKGLPSKKKKPERECKNCSAKYAGRPKFCPDCGSDLIVEKERVDIELGDDDFEMRELGDDEEIRPSRAKIQYINDVRYAYARGFQPGWAALKYKRRTGQWPDKNLKKSIPHKTKWTKDPDTGKNKEVWV